MWALKKAATKVCLISPWGQSWERALHKHKCQRHKCCDQDCPHGEVAFSNSDINRKKCRIKICQITSFMSTMGK